jgi:nucleoside-diphosphate-sugar epimerase
MASYLITGAAGFIGSNLALHLLDQGHSVKGLDNLSNGFQANIDVISSHKNAANFEFIKGDITDFKTCLSACKGVDFVSHQAALGSVPRSIKFPELYDLHNTTGTLNMMRAARDNKVKVFVYASSSSVYGDTPTLPKVETMTPNPKSPYAISKMSTEYYGKAFWDLYQLPTIGLRYFNVFGPRQNPNSQYAAAIPKFITSFLNNTSPIIHGDGEQTRDFTYITNVIQANVNAFNATEKAFGEAFNIGCGDRISIKTLAEQIKLATGATCELEFGDPRPGDVRDSLADINKAKNLLNFSDITPLNEGLKITVEWFKAQHA